jgi:hypothetical protein
MFPVPARPSRGRARGWNTYTNSVRPVAEYVQAQTIPLTRAGQMIVAADGTALVTLGPAGLGAKWYPMTATFTTTTGSTDTSQVNLYSGYVATATLVSGSPFAGGGDTAGLAIPQMTPGDLLIARWTGATPGDVAQMTVVGTQDILDTM